MRLPDIRDGTESYPERVARRPRALNLAAWIATAIAACGFATNVALQFLDPKPGLWKGGAVAALAALIYASVPLLHRFGTLWSALTFTLTLQAHLFSLTWLFGTGGGWQMTYLTASALNFVLTGAERILFSAVLAALAALRISAMLAKQLNDIPPPLRIENGHKERGIPIFVQRIDSCSCIQQHLGDLHVALLRREVEGDEAVTVAEVGVLACFEERTGLVSGTFERAVVQFGAPLTVNHVDVSQCVARSPSVPEGPVLSGHPLRISTGGGRTTPQPGKRSTGPTTFRRSSAQIRPPCSHHRPSKRERRDAGPT